MDNISTDVSGGSAPDSTPAAIAAVGSAPAAPTSEPIGAATAAAPVIEAGESAAPFVVPENDDDLQGQEQNPHVSGILNLRQHVRTLETDFTKKMQPFTVMQEQWGGTERIEQGMNLVGNLFGTDPQTGQSTVPAFVDKVVELSPQTGWSLYESLAQKELPTKYGPMTPAQGLFQYLGLDWDRIEDYQKLTQGKFAIPGSVQIPEGLDPKYHDAFKQLDPADRELWKNFEPHEQQRKLEREMKILADDARLQEVEKFTQESKQRDQQRANQELAAAQQAAQGTAMKEMYHKLYSDLASKWKPSANDQESNLHYAQTMLACMALADPIWRNLAQEQLNASGLQIDFRIVDAAVQKFSVHTDQAIAYARLGEKHLGDLAQAQANGARSQLETLLSHAALAFAGVKSNQLQQVREANNGAIDLARQARPPITGTATEGNGMRPPVNTPAERAAFYKSLPV